MKKGRILLLMSTAILFGCVSYHRNDDRPTDGRDYVKVGDVAIERISWNLFFLTSPAELRRKLIDAAREEAVRRYGDDVRVAFPLVETRWSALSLLLILDLAGYVQEMTLIADVMMPAPEPAPVPPLPVTQPDEAVHYRVFPGEQQEDEYGYVGIEYHSAEELARDIRARLAGRENAEALFEREVQAVNDGGKIVVSIGRKVLSDANTRWFSFTVSEAGKILLSLDGEEGIPNIRGKDGNWWNVVGIPLRAPILDRITVTIADNKSGKRYEFSISRDPGRATGDVGVMQERLVAK